MIVICDTSTGMQAEITSDQLDFIYSLLAEFIASDDEPPAFISDFQSEVLYSKLNELRLARTDKSFADKEYARFSLDRFLNLRKRYVANVDTFGLVYPPASEKTYDIVISVDTTVKRPSFVSYLNWTCVPCGKVNKFAVDMAETKTQFFHCACGKQFEVKGRSRL